ncbi:MAG: hypothetical protein LQ345_005656 [Seirophora villosa]|nr:MAG: hypothetical protein LQ345_005656 [Seirophora villosa]
MLPFPPTMNLTLAFLALLLSSSASAAASPLELNHVLDMWSSPTTDLTGRSLASRTRARSPRQHDASIASRKALENDLIINDKKYPIRARAGLKYSSGQTEEASSVSTGPSAPSANALASHGPMNTTEKNSTVAAFHNATAPHNATSNSTYANSTQKIHGYAVDGVHRPGKTEFDTHNGTGTKSTGATANRGNPTSRVHANSTGANASDTTSTSAGPVSLAGPTSNDTAPGDGAESANSTDTAASPEDTSSFYDDQSADDESPSAFEKDAPAYNPKNLTCDDYLGIRKPADKWSATDGDNAVHGFLEMFNSDKLFCAECFGHSKDECDSKSTACSEGIRTRATPEGGNASWTVAAALFGQYSNADRFTCQIGPNECASAPACEDLNGGDGVSSAAFLQSISNAYLSFQSNYEAIQEAGHDCDKQMAKFSDVFAPVPSSHGDVIAIIIATSLLAGPLSFMGMYAGAIGGIALGLGTGLGMDAMFSSKPGSQDTAGPLGLIVDRVLENYGQFANKLFQDGEYTQPNFDGTADVSITLQNMTRDGKLVSPDMDPKSHFMGLKPIHRRLLYQQLALLTWQKLEVDGKAHVPFIAFDTVPCAEVDPDDEKSVSNSHLDGIEDLDVQVDFQGHCYYLLDAFPKAYAARTSTNRCNGA